MCSLITVQQEQKHAMAENTQELFKIDGLSAIRTEN